MDKYIAVTLGPIFETINLASSPAALWTGSYLFSHLTRTICRLLTERGIPETDILSPYYTASGDMPEECEGVGLFHDRIVFRAGNFSIADFAGVREEAIAHLSQTFQVDEDYLREYLLIRAVECRVENPILDTAVVLDCLELEKPIVRPRQNNPLLSLLVGDTHFGNENIKALPLTRQFQNWQLRKENGQLKSIPDIAGCGLGTGMKKHSYYAIVRADGDRIGQLLSALDSSRVRDFSRDCIFYCAAIARQIQDFGGIAIYSGGDDLLAILPCENPQGQTVFDFIRQANRLFSAHFPEEKYHRTVSLSFGVTLCYYKHPLYEALEDSQYMLFGLAKGAHACTAVHLQKHSGQSEGLVIPHSALGEFMDLYQVLTDDAGSEWVRSVQYKLDLFRTLFTAAGTDRDRIFSLFENLFDAHSHRDNRLLHETLPEFYRKLATSLPIRAVVENRTLEPVDALVYILQLFHFFTEKGGREE